MNAAKSLRSEVKRYIDTADEKIVKMIHAIIEVEEGNDWWDDLPASVKRSILKAEKELGEGKGTPHEVVMKKYKKWLTR
jgi:hypothetical protein